MQAADALILGNRAEAVTALSRLTGGGQPEVTATRLRPGPAIDPALRDRVLTQSACRAVHQLDEWRCCYCARWLIDTRVLDAIGRLVGRPVFPYVNDHYPGPQEATDPAAWMTHPAVRRHAVMVEHVIPNSRMAGANDPRNLRSVCCKCNEWKGHRTLDEMPGLILLDRMSGWDGLTSRSGQLLVLLKGRTTPKLNPSPSSARRLSAKGRDRSGSG
jgi:hypothetical protein